MQIVDLGRPVEVGRFGSTVAQVVSILPEFDGRVYGTTVHWSLQVGQSEPKSSFASLRLSFSALEAAKNDVLTGVTSAAIGGIYQTAEIDEDFDTPTPHTEDCASFISLASSALPKYDNQAFLYSRD